jgi:hypothetical protein
MASLRSPIVRCRQSLLFRISITSPNDGLGRELRHEEIKNLADFDRTDRLVCGAGYQSGCRLATPYVAFPQRETGDRLWREHSPQLCAEAGIEKGLPGDTRPLPRQHSLAVRGPVRPDPFDRAPAATLELIGSRANLGFVIVFLAVPLVCVFFVDILASELHGENYRRSDGSSSPAREWSTRPSFPDRQHDRCTPLAAA